MPGIDQKRLKTSRLPIKGVDLLDGNHLRLSLGREECGAMKFRHVRLLSCSVLVLTPAAAGAESSKATFSIFGTVSTICRLDFEQSNATAQSNGIVNLGHYSELCNDRDGYRVIMEHPAGMTSAAIDLGGKIVPLSDGNETVLVDSDLPAFQTGEARLILADSTQNLGSVSFRVEPKGVVY